MGAVIRPQINGTIGMMRRRMSNELALVRVDRLLKIFQPRKEECVHVGGKGKSV